MMPQLPITFTMHETIKVTRRPSLSARTPPLTAPNIAPMFKIELNKAKEFRSPWNSGGRHKLRGFSEARGAVSPMGMPNEREPHVNIAVKRKVRMRVSVVMGISSMLGPSMGGRSEDLGDMLHPSDYASIIENETGRFETRRRGRLRGGSGGGSDGSDGSGGGDGVSITSEPGDLDF
jgi:hypothetical protein